MDLMKSLFTWVFWVLFIILMFPLTLVIWLLTAPFGYGSNVVHRWLSWQGRVMIKVSPLWKLGIEGRENYGDETNYIIISNHQSLLDIPVIKCLGYNYKWVSKIENFRVPVLGQSMILAGYISLKRGDKDSVIKMMEQSEKALREGQSLLIFPEGTRSPDTNIKRFKSGAFRLAVSTETPILPVLIEGTGSVLPKKGFVFSSGNKLLMKILEPIHPDDFGTDDPDKLAKQVENLMREKLEELRKDEGKQGK